LKKQLYLIYSVSTAVVVILVGTTLIWHEAAGQLVRQRAIAQEAILGRWSVTVPGTVHTPFLLDFPAHGPATCVYTDSAKTPTATVTYQIHQETVQALMADIVRHQPITPPEYQIQISGGPAMPHSPIHRPWLGHLLGDGNVLALSPPLPGVATVLHRLGSG
jgi:hypothetical protein